MNSMKKNQSSTRHGGNIFLWFFTLSIIPLLIAGVISLSAVSNILKQDALRYLDTVSKLKSDHINAFFNERRNNLVQISQQSSLVRIMKDIIHKYKASGKSLKDYIGGNEYDEMTHEIALNLENVLNIYNYRDIFLIDPEGNILISIKDESVCGANIYTGKYSDTRFAHACKKTLETGKPHFSDFEYFGPNQDKPISFLVQVMMDTKKNKVGIMAIRIPMTEITQIIQENTGDSMVENYLIGTDLLMRSESRFEKKSTALKVRVDTEGARGWLNLRGEKVMGISCRLENLEKLGVEWMLITEIRVSEFLKPARNLRMIFIFVLLVTIIFITLFSLFKARQIKGSSRTEV